MTITIKEQSSDKVIVRQFQPQDQERCIELFRMGLCSYKDSPMDILNPWFVNLKLKEDMGNIYKHYIANDNEQSNFWVAELNGEVVGCVGAMPDEKDCKALELIRMSVDASIRRKGIASLMITQVENFAISCGFCKVSLTTLVTMLTACAFYEGCGYTRMETFKFKIPEGVEAHVQPFMKELSVTRCVSNVSS